MTVKITLETMKFHAFHGVMEDERIIGGTFLVDILYIIETDAIETDRIEDTINYAEIFEIVKAEMQKPSNLIEHVAGHIIKVVKNNFPQISHITIKISKLNPPVDGEMEKASVSITC